MIQAHHLKFMSRYVRNRFRKIHPSEIQAYITSACNQKCIYCISPEARTGSLSTEQWLSLIRRLGRLGTLRFKFQGGEPTLRKDFRVLSREAKRCGMRTALVTNGLLLGSCPELLDFVDELVLSLDSTRKSVNDSIRGPGSYDAVLKSMDLSRSRKIKTFINMVVVKDNLSDIESMLEFAEKRGVLLNVQPAMYDRKYFVRKNPEFAISNEDCVRINQRLADWKRQGRGLLFSSKAYQKGADWPDFDQLTINGEERSPCMAGRDYFHIESNGDVHPCGLHGADFTPKNIIRDGFDAAFENAGRHNCVDCWMPFMNERKDTFGLKLSAIREILRRN